MEGRSVSRSVLRHPGSGRAPMDMRRCENMVAAGLRSPAAGDLRRASRRRSPFPSSRPPECRRDLPRHSPKPRRCSCLGAGDWRGMARPPAAAAPGAVLRVHPRRATAWVCGKAQHSTWAHLLSAVHLTGEGGIRRASAQPGAASHPLTRGPSIHRRSRTSLGGAAPHGGRRGSGAEGRTGFGRKSSVRGGAGHDGAPDKACAPNGGWR